MTPLTAIPSHCGRHLQETAAGCLALALLLSTAPARAADGCLVLLCLAAPSWKSILQCVDPVRELFRDMARGRPFPSCSMSGNGSNATHQPAYAPGNCPDQYTLTTPGVDLPIYSCRFAGVVSVTVDGLPWSRVWWNRDESVTEYLPAAKARLGTWETGFDNDLALWTAAHPPIPASTSN